MSECNRVRKCDELYGFVQSSPRDQASGRASGTIKMIQSLADPNHRDSSAFFVTCEGPKGMKIPRGMTNELKRVEG